MRGVVRTVVLLLLLPTPACAPAEPRGTDIVASELSDEMAVDCRLPRTLEDADTLSTEVTAQIPDSETRAVDSVAQDVLCDAWSWAECSFVGQTTVFYCSEDGTEWKEWPCPPGYGCICSKCEPILCMVGESRCVGMSHVHECQVVGCGMTWVEGEPCPEGVSFCKDGECVTPRDGE